MNLLLDTNILVDVLRKRDFDYEESRLLLALGKLHEFELWISPSQLSDLFYILTSGGKRHLAKAVSAELSDLFSFVRVCALGHDEANTALACGFDDLEDALICQAARSVRAEAIITRNQRDFEASPIPARSSKEFFAWLAAEKGLNYAEIALQPS